MWQKLHNNGTPQNMEFENRDSGAYKAENIFQQNFFFIFVLNFVLLLGNQHSLYVYILIL